MNLQWVKLKSGEWPNLETVNLENVTVTGVYVIWNSLGQAVRVGQGDIVSRLYAHRRDGQILAHKQAGLYVTWAAVPSAYLDGVELYLAQQCNPLVGDRFPKASPLHVNLPA